MINNETCIFLFLTLPTLFYVAYSKDCTFRANDSPLVLNPTTEELILPIKGLITVKNGEKIGLFCTDDNVISQTKFSLIYATCDGKDNSLKLSQGQQNIPFEQIKCQKPIRGDVFKTTTPCANKGHLSYIGFSFKGNIKPLLTVCYDYVKGNALYSQHDLDGKNMDNGPLKPHRPDFSTSGLSSTIKADEVYKTDAQKNMFKKLLGFDKFIEGTFYLARGHLSPDADFRYDVFQRFTYFYINVCPQWQSINIGNWKSVELSVRKAATSYLETFTVITGTHEILSLKNSKGAMTEVFLNENKIPVPKYIWKIVYNKNSNKGIAIIILNNPNPEVEDYKLCNDVCEGNGWGTKNWKTVSKGYTQCCDLTSFAKIIKTAPIFTDNGVLRAVK